MDSIQQRQDAILAQLERLQAALESVYADWGSFSASERKAITAQYALHLASSMKVFETVSAPVVEPSPLPAASDIPETVQRVVAACQRLQLRASLYHVASDYYDWTLERRRNVLGAPSIHHLCKTIVMENTRFPGFDFADKTHSRYYCIVVQYSSRFDAEKMLSFVRTLKTPPPSKSKINFRLVDAEVSLRLTGFANNGVCPIGTTEKLPIVVSNRLLNLQPPVFWLGGGHVDWKLCSQVDEFIAATDALVADVVS